MKENQKKILLWVLDLAVNLAVIIILVVVIQKWIIAPFDVSGSSMCDTLNLIEGECHKGEGEKIIINEATYAFGEPQRGEIVVFKADAKEEKYFIKRIIGIPGDKIELKGGNVFINDIRLEENYLNPENKGRTEPFFSDFSTFNVPEGKYFLLGDNRIASTDSRSCFQSSISLECKNSPEKAFVEKEHIRGRAWFVWWPLGNIRLLYQAEYPELSASLEEK
ncbi:signal peptidase I [Candidatus Peregrinibacteria bacterium]|nr:signal peptidase I [Candidatus Peregrinibacteria bacterium]